MCPHCRAFITTKDRVCPYCNETVAPPVRSRTPGPILGGMIPHARFNTVIILLINTALFLAMEINPRVGSAGAMFAPGIENGQWWRLITAGFLHGGVLHILMNSWALFDLGAMVEEMYGSSRMLVIYFVSNIAGFYLSYRMGNGVSVGASAALFGLIGCMIALGIRERSSIGSSIRGMFIRWAIYGLMFSFLPGIDIWAHIGGLIGGFAIGYVAGEPREGAPVEKLWRVAAWFAIVITLGSFAEMYLWFSSSM